MHPHARWLRLASSALLLGLLGVLWAHFAPAQLGGRAAYIIVMGTSMEPTYHRGDLVIVHQAPQYAVGDVVTYRHPDIGPVIHRIVALDGARFILKGDNNAWRDGYRPTADELIGRRWLQLPGVGRLVEQLRRPWAMALVTVALGFLVMRMAFVAEKRRPRERAATPARRVAPGSAGLVDSAMALLAVLAVAAAIVGGLAFARPVSRTVEDQVPYQVAGEFSYTAGAPAGVYDGAAAHTGDPIFPQVSSTVEVAFSYRLTADTSAVAGTARMVAELGDASGWKRTLELAPSRRFDGSTVTLRGVLDLAEVAALIHTFEERTAAPRQQYSLALVPDVVVEGSIAGQALRDTFSPRLEFRLDQRQMEVARTGDKSADPFNPARTGAVPRADTAPNTLGLLGAQLDVAATRRMALLVGGLALAGLAALGLRGARAMRHDEAARIRARYGSLLVEIGAADAWLDGPMLQVATIDDLARVAAAHNCMILHVPQGRAARYVVQTEGPSYCYAPQSDASARPALRAARDASWQSVFLHGLREGATVAEACQAAAVSLSTVYRERERDPKFERALVAARTQAHPAGESAERW